MTVTQTLREHLSRDEIDALHARHHAAMTIIRDIHDLDGRLSLLAAVIAPSDPLLGLSRPRNERRERHPPTPRQLEILQLLSEGHSYEGTARELGISKSGVREQTKLIRRRLDVTTTVEAVSICYRRGWIV
jgi:DNA-binding NarL/FixJ family response regulator